MKRALLPISLVAFGLSLLIGCLYITTFERPASPAQPDFRKLVGNDAGRVLRTGYADRAAVLRLLGSPPLTSADGSSLGYLFETRQGYWVAPLCFFDTYSADNKVYGLRLDFDNDNVLRQFKAVSTDQDDGYGFSGAVGSVIYQLNESGAPLRWNGNRSAADFDLGRR